MMRKLTIVSVLIFLTFPAFSATITAIASGNWTTTNTAIWSTGTVPGPSDTIIIPSGITVTIPYNQWIDLRGAGTAVIIIQDGGTLHLQSSFFPFGLASLWMDSGDGSKIILETTNSSLNLDIGTSIVQGGNIFFIPGNYNGPAVLEDGVLPIELLYFKARPQESVVLLEWATLLEENFDYFTVERSYDGMNFENIAEIQGAGNTTDRQFYSFEDPDPLPGQLYYRLKATDFDGAYEYFDIVTVRYAGTGSNAITLYPNPVVNGRVTVRLDYIPGEGTSLQIYDLKGRKYGEQALSESRETVSLPADMAAGVYILRIVDRQRRMQSRLVVR